MGSIQKFFSDLWHHLVEGGGKERLYRKRFYIIFALVVAGLCTSAVLRATQGHGSQFDDFTAFSSELLFQKINVYEEYSFDRTSIGKYPPFFGVVYAPVAWMPLPVGAAVWFLVSLTLIILASKACARAVWRLSGSEGEPPTAYWVIPLLMMTVNVITNLGTSQVNILIFALVAFGLDRFALKKDFYAGIFLGIATAIKLTPGLMVAYFAYKGAWRVVLGAAVGGLLCWGVLLPLIAGPGYFVTLMESWWGILSGYLEEGTMKETISGFRHTNQSLSAVVFRYITEIPAGGGIENFYINILNIPFETADTIVNGIKVLMIALLLFISRAPITERNDPRLPFEMSLFLVATLFISPISWINHYILLVLPYAAMVYFVRTQPAENPDRKLAIRALVACGILMAVSPRLLQAFSLPFFGVMGLFVTMMVLIVREGKRRKVEVV